MKCFRCHKPMYQRVGKFGYYYKCATCGKIVETSGQKSYNSKKYPQRRLSQKLKNTKTARFLKPSSHIIRGTSVL